MENYHDKEDNEKEKPNEFEYNNIQLLNYMEYIEKAIVGDGNCFYRCISYYFLETEEFHLEYRNLLYDFMTKNKHLFIDFINDTNAEVELSENERMDILTNKIENIKIAKE